MIYKHNFEEIVTVLFFANYNTKDLLGLASFISGELKIFDGAPMLLPIQDNDAPLEIPRIILKNEDSSSELQVSFLKATLILRKGSETQLETCHNLTNKLVEIFVDKVGWNISRIGRVARIKAEIDINSVNFIKDKYISSSKLDEALQIQLNWLIREEWENDKVNCWLKIDSGNDFSKPNVFATIDVNLIATPDRRMDVDFSSHFSSYANELIKKATKQVLEYN
jgi:hypothetical protein